MKYNFQGVFVLTLLVFMFSCESENIEDKYNNGIPGDTTHQNGNYAEIAWLPLNGDLNDKTGNNIPLVIAGKTKFVEGINAEHGKGIYLDGSSYLVINLGYYDTISMIFWIKGDGALESTNKPVLFDYGLNALSMELDATTGATALSIKKNEDIASSDDNPSVEYLNSFTRYTFVYIEAGGDKTKVYFKGYSAEGNEISYQDEFNFPGIIDAKSDILYIGRSSIRENQSSSFFRGAIDEIHIYNKILSSSEVEKMASIPTE